MPMEPIVSKHTNDLECTCTMQPSGAPEALHGRSEQPQSAVSMLPERLTRARNASHTPPRLWQEALRRRVRIEAGNGRKPAQSSSSRPPDHDWDVTNRLHRLLNRRPANQTPLKTRGTHPTRASAVTPAKTRTPTDATPPCIIQKPPPAVSLFASRARSPVCSSPPCSLPPSSALQPSPPADLLPPADTDDTRCFSTPAGAWYRPEPDAPRGRLMSLLMSAHCFFNLSSFLYSHCPPLVRVGLCGHKGALPCRGEHGPHRPTRTHTSCRRLEQPPNRPVHACEPPRAHAAFGKMP